jgi:osmotically-inducible protein OsmY
MEPAVKTPFRNHAAIMCVCLVLLCGAAAAVAATGVAAPRIYSVPDAELRDRVQLALHDDPYFYDGHVEVSVDDGVVYLQGLVFSDWDLRDALRIAGKAAGDRRVINNLTLIQGGRR